MAAYRRVYDSRHLQTDCQEPGSAPEPSLGKRVWATFFLPLKNNAISLTGCRFTIFRIFCTSSNMSEIPCVGWWRGTVVERRSLAGELSLSCARPAADG